MLYERYAHMAMGICMRYSAEKSDAEDVMQDAFITIFRKLDQYAGKGELGAWIRKVVVNTALMHYRKNKKRTLHIELNEPGIQPESSEDILQKMAAQDLLRYVQALPDGYRMVFNLYGVEGYTHPEVAEMLRISVGTSKSQYSRARKLLIENIQKEEYQSLHGKIN